MGIVPTTILPPRAAHKYVTRETIERLVKGVGTARVVTVSSPAGFGKTTAMLRWAEILAEQGRPVLWIAARAGIESLGTFKEALRQALIAAGLPAIDEPMEQDRQAWLASLSSVSGPKPGGAKRLLQSNHRHIINALYCVVAVVGQAWRVVLTRHRGHYK